MLATCEVSKRMQKKHGVTKHEQGTYLAEGARLFLTGKCTPLSGCVKQQYATEGMCNPGETIDQLVTGIHCICKYQVKFSQ